MADENESDFKFYPRPEAHPMNWDELLSPVQDAVRDLLVRIEGATQREIKGEDITANCFLVYGDRGTGKTTVLLSARHACDPNQSFFKEMPRKVGKGDAEKRGAAKARADKLQNVIWLDVLDLEPLPPRANLLTTVLTRVRNALYPAGPGKQVTEMTSILEESADSARHKLSQLINDATLMWEDISEPDTRSRANRQVAAADIYAQFRDRFKDAMDTLSRELGRRSGSAEKHCPLILPIDNIDRSTDHLYGIVKLAQMVSCPHLWLVMAGDRQDVDTFLERAFWKELIRIGEGAGAAGKAGLGGEDEALVMARRQAAAASHKLLPPSHRVEVHLVKPEETLGFYSPDKGESVTIRKLLEETKVTGTGKGRPEIRLVDLFDAARQISDVVGETGEDCLTDAAELGLRLSARGVLDLWQIVYGTLHDATVDDTHKAEHIARTMLRNAVTESTISSETGRRLQDQILRRTPTRGTMLDFWDPSRKLDSTLEVLRLTSLEFELRLGVQPLLVQNEKSEGGPEKNADEKPYAAWVDSGLRVIQTKAVNLRLLELSPEQDTKATRPDMLPDLAAAWLAILHDAVMFGAADSTVISRPDIRPSALVQCFYASSSGKGAQAEWPMPHWESFIAHDIYGRLWRHFLSTLNGKPTGGNLLDQAGREGALPSLMATGWVACALETFSIFPPGKWERAGGILTSLTNDISCGEHCKPGGIKGAIKKAELDVMRHAADIYKSILSVNASKGTVLRADEGMWPMRSWLERELPLLLSHLYVPAIDVDVKPRAEEIVDFLEGTELVGAWETNTEFLSTEIWRRLVALCPPNATPVPAGPFADLLVAMTKPAGSGG